MKLSELLDSLKSVKKPDIKKSVKIWKPKLWTPKPMEFPVTVYILSDKDFEISAKSKGFKKRIGAFAVWGKDSEGNPVNKIYMRFHKLSLFPHEIRHLQTGHFHD